MISSGIRLNDWSRKFVQSVEIYGGKILMTTSWRSHHDPCFFELDITRLHSLLTVCKRFQREYQFTDSLDCPFAVPLTSKVGLAVINSKNYLAVMDFRDSSLSASTWIVQGDTDLCGFMSGVKAASRLFLQGCDRTRYCMDHGRIFSTRMRCDPDSTFFAFSDTSPIVGMFNDQTLRLFDVKKEQLIATIEANFMTIQLLFIDGMPHIIGTDGRSSKPKIIL